MDAWEWIEIQSSKFGKGLFARRDIPAGTPLCRIGKGELSFEETVALKEKESHAVQVELDRYLYCDDPFLFCNHSCAPNCAVNASMELFALTHIRKDEELFWDYSTSMLERHWTMRCSCGHTECRGLITDFDLLPEPLQRKYLELNIVFPYIAHFLAQDLARSA